MEIALPISQANRRELVGAHPNSFAPAAQGRDIVVANTSSTTADEYVLQGEVLSGRQHTSRDAYGETYGPASQSRQSTYQAPPLSTVQIRSGIDAYLEQPITPNGALQEPLSQIDYYV